MKTFYLNNRRYIGSKAKLLEWIFDKVASNTEGVSFFDVFAGTGVVSEFALSQYQRVVMNDFLFSNRVIYDAFFSKDDYCGMKIIDILTELNDVDPCGIEENYFSINFGNKYFGKNDAKKIGYLREEIQRLFLDGEINKKEYNILLASLIYSVDRIANTVGHFETYIKDNIKDNLLELGLIQTISTENNMIEIYREDANKLVREICADIVFIDPPYNSRQYSRFYHLIENLVQWEKPELFGVALKPKEQNMSEYCKTGAKYILNDLMDNVCCKYIVVTYNNTYSSKSSSSRNKIALDDLLSILERKGETMIFEKSYKYFNTGKTEFKDHRELLFITKVQNEIL